MSRVKKMEIVQCTIHDWDGEETTIEKHAWKCIGCGRVWNMRNDAMECEKRGHVNEYMRLYGVKHFLNNSPVGGGKFTVRSLRREAGE